MDRLPAENDNLTDWINVAPPFDSLDENVRHLMNPDESDEDALNIFERLTSTACESNRVLVEPVNVLIDDDVTGMSDIFSLGAPAAASGSSSSGMAADEVIASGLAHLPLLDEDVSAVASRILFEGIAEENAVFQQTFDSSIDKSQNATEQTTDGEDTGVFDDTKGVNVDKASTSDQLLNDTMVSSDPTENHEIESKPGSPSPAAAAIDHFVVAQQPSTPVRRSQRRVERELRMSAEEIRRKNVEEEAEYLKAKRNSIDDTCTRRPKQLGHQISATSASFGAKSAVKEDDDDDKPLSKCVIKIAQKLPQTNSSKPAYSKDVEYNDEDEEAEEYEEEIVQKSGLKTLNGESESEYSANDDVDEEDEFDEDFFHNEEPMYCYKCAKIGMPGKMIHCMKCKNWFHNKCENFGRFSLAAIKNWHCSNCLNETCDKKHNQSRESSGLKLKLKTSSMSDFKRKKHGREKSHVRKGDQLVKQSKVSSTEKSKKLCVVCEKRVVESPESIYCGEICVEKVAKMASRFFKDENHRVMVMERGGSNAILNGPMAPMLKNFSVWLKKHRKYYPVLPTKTSFSAESAAAPPAPVAMATATTTTAPVVVTTIISRKTVESSSTGSNSSANAPASNHTPDQVRLGVRRTLRDCLINRAKEADDVLLSNEEIKRIAVDVENEMYKLYGDTGTNYKQQFKGLVVNLKDGKNRGFFRRILNGVLSAAKTASMSGQEMASKENSFWQTANSETVEEHSPVVVAPAKVEIKPRAVSFDKGKLFTKTKAEADSTGDLFGLLATDTTFQHKSHLFDLNCKICTGKQNSDDAVVKKVEKASSVASETPTRRDSISSDLNSPLAGFEPSTSSAEENRRKLSRERKLKDADRSSKPVSSLMVKGAAVPSSASSPGSFRPPVDEDCIWNGLLDMPGHFHFKIGLVGVSGLVDKLPRDLPNHVKIVGRIPSVVVYDYVKSVKTAPTRDVIVVRVAYPNNLSDQLQYDGLFDNMISKNRYCAVETSKMPKIKDFYFLPLSADRSPDPSLLPFDGQGLPVPRENLILAIIVRRRDPVIPEKPPPVPQVPESLKSKMISSHLAEEKPIEETVVLDQQSVKPASDAGVRIIRFSSSDNEEDQKHQKPANRKGIAPHATIEKRFIPPIKERSDPRLESSLDSSDPAKRFKPNNSTPETPGTGVSASNVQSTNSEGWMNLWSNMFSSMFPPTQSTGGGNLTSGQSAGGMWPQQFQPANQQQPPPSGGQHFPPMNFPAVSSAPMMPSHVTFNQERSAPMQNSRLPYAPLPPAFATSTPVQAPPVLPAFPGNTSMTGVFFHGSSGGGHIEDGEIVDEEDDGAPPGSKKRKLPTTSSDKGDVDWRKFNIPKKFNLHSDSSSSRRDSSHGDRDYRSKKYW